MFFIPRKSLPVAPLLEGFCDLHCHLLPGVDDGSPDAATSIALLDRLHALGMRAACLTPHIMAGKWQDNGARSLREHFDAFDYKGPVTLSLGAEHFLDERFATHLAGGPLTLPGGVLLVEFSRMAYLPRQLELIFEAALNGHTILIAHPERYTFLSDRPDTDPIIRQLRDTGCLFQLNLLSLVNFYHSDVQPRAEKFLKAGLYSYLCTDVHAHRHVDALAAGKTDRRLLPLLEPLCEANRALFLTETGQP